MSIAIIRLCTGPDEQSHFETIDLETTESAVHDLLSNRESVRTLHFALTPP